MKNLKTLLFISLSILASCAKIGKQEDHHHNGGNSEENPNQALYDQVMDIHDEIMPRAEDIELAEGKKQELELVIAQLDSADQSMMDWMHLFKPLPDSADQEKARAYLESEMERIKKVKDLMNESIEKAKAVKN